MWYTCQPRTHEIRRRALDKSHKQVVTTYPVAIKYGQGRIHVPNPIPWHGQCETIKCPHCPTIFVVTVGYPRIEFLNQLESDHKGDKEHADCISSAPTWTNIADCD